LQISEEFDDTVEGRIRFEGNLVNEMNKWMGCVSFENRDQFVVLKHFNDDKIFTLLTKTSCAMKQMFEPYKVSTVDQAVIIKFEKCLPEDKKELSSIRKKKDGSSVNSGYQNTLRNLERACWENDLSLHCFQSKTSHF
jgi:hypothetical protein